MIMTKYVSVCERFKTIILFGCAFISGILLPIYLWPYLNLDSVQVPMEQFPEPSWRTESTLAVKTVASTPFARFEVHQVRTENGFIVNDWLWTDERSHVNILVHLKNEDKFLLFHQKKYGLERAYYAVLGGLFNDGEGPLDCARRELLEEAGLEAEELVNLGKYRVQVNRGGGYLHILYAKNCVYSSGKSSSEDYETQEARKLSRNELLEVALSGGVGEAQWLACVALGLLYDGNKTRKSESIGAADIAN